MRSRCSVAVIAALLASSLLLTPAKLAEALADAPNCLEFISRTQTLDAPDGASAGGPISDDGRYVVFTSAATNLGLTDTNGAVRDVFVRDTLTSSIDLVSRSTAGTQTAFDADAIAISADGRFVLFASAGALVEPDIDARRDLFLRDRTDGTTIRVSTDADNTWSPSGTALDADVSDDGRFVSYVTAEPHAVADTNVVADVYRFDRVAATRVLVSAADDETPLVASADGVSMSSDGRLVLFHSTAVGAPGVRTAAVRDVTAGTTRLIGPGNGFVNRNGLEAIVLTGTALSVTDLVANTALPIDPAPWGLPAAADRKLFDTSASGRYVLLGHGPAPYQFFVVDRVGQRAFTVGPETGVQAYVGDGGLVSATSVSTTQAFVWRGPVASMSLFSPTSIDRGTAASVTLTGTNLLPGTSFDFGPGVSVSNFQFVNLQQASITVSVSAGAPLGFPTILVTAPGGCTTSSSGFEITDPPPATTTTTTTSTTTTLPTTTSSSTTTLPTTTTSTTTTSTTTTTIPVSTTAPTTTLGAGPTPDATAISPALVRPGTNRSISIAGTGFTPGASVAIDGLTVTSTVYVDAQHLVATVNVPSTADGVYDARVTNSNNRTDGSPPAFVVRGSDGEFHAMQPYRAFDSRSSTPVVGERAVQLTNLPASGVRAIVANLTVTGGTADSYLTTFVPGAPRPTASSINFKAGETKANMVTLTVDGQNQVAVFNPQGAVEVIIDIVGWYSDTGTTFGSVFIGLDPFRRFDSRVDRSAPLGPGESISVPIVGTGSTAAAVMLNVTVTGATAESYLTAWPTGTARPTTSNINYVAGSTVPNVVVVPIGSGGSVDFFNFTGEAHVIIDVLGVFEGGQVPFLGGRFSVTTPTRALDTRLGIGGTATALAQSASLSLDVRPAGVPSDATAVVMNVTVAAPTVGGYLTVWPAGGSMPNSSNLNFGAGQVTANLVVVPIGPNGGVRFFNAFGSTHVIADVVGYYR